MRTKPSGNTVPNARPRGQGREERPRRGMGTRNGCQNGETKPQVMARSKHILLTHKSRWNPQQQERAGILFRMFPALERAYNLYLELVDIFNKDSSPAVARLNLARWVQ